MIKKDKKTGIEKCLFTTVFSLLQLSLLMDSTVYNEWVNEVEKKEKWIAEIKHSLLHYLCHI